LFEKKEKKIIWGEEAQPSNSSSLTQKRRGPKGRSVRLCGKLGRCLKEKKKLCLDFSIFVSSMRGTSQ